MNTDKDGKILHIVPSVKNNDDADEKEFKSLKGIAGMWLDIDDVRRERLKL